MSANKKNMIAIPYDKFNAETDFGYTKVRPNKAGGKSVGIIRDGGQLIVNTPLVMCWGAQEMVSPDGGRTTYSLSIQFPTSQYPNDEADKLLTKMKAFEERIKRDAVKHSKEWLGKTSISAEGVDLLFNPMLSYSIDKSTGERNPDRAPTLRIKLDKWPGRDGGESKFDCELYDVKNKLIFPDPNDDEVTPLDLIPQNSHVACAIKCGGLYFVNGKFGVTWRLFQAVVKPRESLRGKCCIALSEEEKERVIEDDDSESDSEAAVLKDDEPDETAEDSGGAAEEDQPEEDQPEEEETTPAPEPAKKKVVRRKKDTST